MDPVGLSKPNFISKLWCYFVDVLAFIGHYSLA